MAENKTNIEDLNASGDSGELTDSEVSQISGGQEEKPLIFIDTIYSSGLKSLDIAEDKA